MFALPSLAGIPHVLRARGDERTFAAMALEILPRKLSTPPPLSIQYGLDGPIERHALEWRLREDLDPALDTLQVFDTQVRLHTDRDEARVFFGNRTGDHVGSEWTLERRWKSIEARAPGLASAALHTLDEASRCAVPLFTPSWAMYFCEYVQWRGEHDEREVILEIIDNQDDVIDLDKVTDKAIDNLAAEYNILRRRDVDKWLPPMVQIPRPMGEARLRKLTRGRGEVAEIARAVIHLRAAVRQARAVRKEPRFEASDSDSLIAYGFGAMLRWNARDPMTRFLDDYGQYESESSTAVEPVYGWYDYTPGSLPAIVKALRTRIELARATEQLIPMIATRVE